MLPGESLSCGEQRFLFEATDIIDSGKVMTIFKRFTIEIKYESIYNEVFLLKDKDDR